MKKILAVTLLATISLGLVACSKKDAQPDQLIIAIPTEPDTQNESSQPDKQTTYTQLFQDKTLIVNSDSFLCEAPSQNFIIQKTTNTQGDVECSVSTFPNTPQYEIRQLIKDNKLYFNVVTPTVSKWYNVVEWDKDTLQSDSVIQSLLQSTEVFVHEVISAAQEVKYIESSEKGDVVEIFCGEEMVMMDEAVRTIYRFTVDPNTYTVTQFEKILRSTSTDDIANTIVFTSITDQQFETPTALVSIHSTESTHLENEYLAVIQGIVDAPTLGHNVEAPTLGNNETIIPINPDAIDWQSIIRDGHYTLDSSQVSTNIANFITMEMIHTPSGEDLYAVYGSLEDSKRIETFMYQKDDGDIYYYTYDNTIDTPVDQWYICDVNAEYDMCENTLDLNTFHDIFASASSVELVDFEDNVASLKVYTSMLTPNVMEENGQNVYEVNIDMSNYRIYSIKYYYMEFEGIISWEIQFPQHSALDIIIPDAITERIDVLDAHNAVSMSLPRLTMLKAEEYER